MRFLRQFWRRAFFSEMNPIIERGSRHNLNAADLPDLPAKLDPRAHTIDEADLDWTSGPALLKSLLSVAKRGWMLPLGFYLANAALNLSGPVLVNLFVKRLDSGVMSGPTLIEALLYAMAIGGSGVLAGLCIQHYFHKNLHRLQIVINVVSTKVFNHSLNLSKAAREKIPVGDIVNHLSTDTDAVGEVTSATSDLIYCSLMISGVTGLLFYYLGSTAWVAVILLATLITLTKKVIREFTPYD
jgi:ABC-type multidrug transport system fused ATPase/permease subunit